MTYEIGQHPGTTWRRIDIQCHTPRDRDWRGSPDLPGGDTITEAARRSWASNFIKAAINQGLSVIAITDHPDIALLPYVIEAAQAQSSEHQIVVLPGIEITCRDSVQCLAIFDPKTTEEHWQRLLNKLPNVSVAHKDMAKAGETAERGLAVDALFRTVAEDAVLNDLVILIPHFGNEGAHKSLNQSGFAARARELPCV